MILEAYEPADDYSTNVRSISTNFPAYTSQYAGYVLPKVPQIADCADGESYFAGSNIKIL